MQLKGTHIGFPFHKTFEHMGWVTCVAMYNTKAGCIWMNEKLRTLTIREIL